MGRAALGCGPGACRRPWRIDPEGTRAMNPTDIVDRESLREDVPDFAPGDTLKVHVRVVEGNRQRDQVFQGAVIRRQGFEDVHQVRRCELEPNGSFYVEAIEPSIEDKHHAELIARLDALSKEIAALRAQNA